MNAKLRALSLGLIIFIGLFVAKIIGGNPVTLKSFIPPLAGGLVGGLVVYFF